jgi:hypothetical protein
MKTKLLKQIKLGVATDHGGFKLKIKLISAL